MKSFRDAEWESRERAYHDAALQEVNALVRKYNGLAPYPVRRPYHVLSAELERAYQESEDDILRGISQRVKDGVGIGAIDSGVSGGRDEASAGIASLEGNAKAPDPDVNWTGRSNMGVWDLLQSWWRKMSTPTG